MALPFAGFPDGRLAATVVPSVFFAEAMASIDDLDELKLILHLFWRMGQRHPAPKYIQRSDLLADRVVRGGLSSSGEASVTGALDRLVGDRLILRRTVERAGQNDEWYFLNTQSGRRAVADLEAGTLEVGLVAQPEEPLRADLRSSIFHLYEQNVGLLTPLVVDELTMAEREYPGEWIEEAFREAVRRNRRSWSYVSRILQRWSVEGKGDSAVGGRASRSSGSSPDRAST